MEKMLIMGKGEIKMDLFSVKKDKKHKIITLLGFKIKIKIKEKSYPIEHLLCNFWFKYAKVQPNKIIFINPVNFQFACNLKYIAGEMLKRNINADFVWVCNKKTNKNLLPKNFRCVPYASVKFLYEAITSKVWICNSHMFLPLKMGLKKKKETIYFQTFHGSMGIKKIDGDAENVYKNLGWLKWQKKHAALFDYLFTDSQMEYDIFTSAFWGNGKIEKIGKARDSIFYKNHKPIIQKVKEFYNISKENKIALYAPTWRPEKQSYCFNIDAKLLSRCLEKRFGGKWNILIRAHSHMKKNFNILFDSNLVTDATDYIDMQELLVASDVLISDYSSCIPEYLILNKPSFIYAVDYNYYNNNNGFYYPLEILPCPIAGDNGELMYNILNFNENDYKQKTKEFLTKMGHKDDENSCIRIVDFILEKTKIYAE